MLAFIPLIWWAAPKSVGDYADLVSYNWIYTLAYTRRLDVMIGFGTFEPGFTYFLWLFSKSGIPFLTFVFLIKTVFMTSVFVFIRNVFPSFGPFNILFSIILLLYAPFVSMTNNVVRQGAAMSFVFFFLAFSMSKKWQGMGSKAKILLSVVVFGIASLFHSSVLILMPTWLLSRVITIRTALTIWFIIAPLYVVNFIGLSSVIAYIFRPLTSLNRSVNLSYTNYELGFKPAFLLASLMPVIAYLLIKLLKVTPDRKYNNLFNFYLILNGFGMLMSYLPYHDRIFLYSWSFIPFLLVGSMQLTLKQIRFHWNNPSKINHHT
ncbi:EpsG family protein [Deinococcus aetherius]